MQSTTETTFTQDVLASVQPALVFVWAPWCHNCKAMTPHMQKMAGEFKNEYHFFKVNGDENRELLKKYKVFGLPTLLFFSHGRLVFRKTGTTPISVLAEKIDKLKNLSEDEAIKMEIKGLIRWPFKR